MVHRFHGSVRTSIRGSRFYSILVEQLKEEIYFTTFNLF